jgi:serine/threonine-protein kinase
MGTVHLARIVGLGGFERFVVVKRLNDATASDPAMRERFLSEARVAARFHHANVIGTHYVGSDERGLYMVLDYVEGASLADLVDRAALRGERLEIPVLLRVALDVLAGLDAVHRATDEQGEPLHIVHRDVSTQNVLVGRDGIARLADFGIAKGARSSVATKTGAVVGKLLYLPPEYILREPLGATTDIYMLGVTLWCAITGANPWHAEDEAQLIHQILNVPVPPLASHLDEPVAPEIEALVARACDPDPGARFDSARAMIEAIDRLGRERGWVASQNSVAAVVEALAGVDLARRRERMASRSAERQYPRREDSASRGSPGEPQERRPSKWFWALTVPVVSGALLIAWSLHLEPSSDRTDAAVDPEPSPSASPPTNLLPVAASTHLEPPPTPTPTRVLTHSAPAAQPSAAQRFRTPRRVAAESGPPPPPIPDATSRPRPALPDQIATHNPYR